MADIAPRCSADGKWVYYQQFPDIQNMRVPMDGGQSEIVPGSVIPNSIVGTPSFDFSPDGKTLAFLSTQTTKNGTAQHIALVNLDTAAKSPARLIDADPRITGAPIFSADGKAVIYNIIDNGKQNLWLQPLDGSRGRLITNFQGEAIWSYGLSPDRKTLALLTNHSDSDVVLLRDTGASSQ
jgi:Tol biopolymer transport system component